MENMREKERRVPRKAILQPENAEKITETLGSLTYNLKDDQTRLLPKKLLKGPSELNAEDLGAQHMK